MCQRIAALPPAQKAAAEKLHAATALLAEKDKRLDLIRYTCRQLVEKTLKDPETAQFADYHTYYAEERKGARYLVQVKVRAKKSFNAIPNSTMECRVRKDKKGNWTLVSIEQIN